jgi:hypothetical protein
MGIFGVNKNWPSSLFVIGTLLGTSLMVTGCSTAASIISGEVVLDSQVIEENIQDEVLKQSGLNVVVECPDPMSGQVGDSRQCLAEDDFGQTYLIDVTIQNRDGYIIWQIQQ